MPPERTEKRRQDPVSCENCRTKKLKCDRQQPCANCSSRQWKCHYRCERLPRAASQPTDQSLQTENRLLQARLDRLEKAVFGNGSQELASIIGQVPKDSPQAASPEQNFQHEHDVETTRWLEKACDNLVVLVPDLSDRLQIAYREADQLAVDAENLVETKVILVPSRQLTLRCLDLYETYLDAAQHVMHLPTVRKAIHNFYARDGQEGLEQLKELATADTGIVALILTMCAHVGLWDARRGQVSRDFDSAIKSATVLAKQALEAVEHARNTCIVSVEIVQAVALLVFLLYHLEGFSSRTRLLLTSALTMARDLELHKTDDPRTKRNESRMSREALIQLEVGRKLWWHITSTDWLLAFMGGPHEGVYSSHPRHMAVNIPRNVNNDDLLLKSPSFRRPDSETTVATYSLLRIKLATLCREAVDNVCYTSPENVPYEVIHSLDAKFANLINGFPKELQLDVPTAIIKRELGSAYQPQLAEKRALANLMAYSRRCKLHLPYMVRVKFDAQYAFSRQKCLESARRILWARKIVLDETSGAQAAFLHLGGILHHIFYAAMVLVMDLCLNVDHTHEELLEVREALSIIEDARSKDRMASRFLDSLGEMMKRHRIKLPDAEMSNAAPPRKFPLADAFQPQQAQFTAVHQAPDATVPTSNIDQIFDVTDFEDVWQDFMGDAPYLDPQSWNALISDLEMRMI